MGTEIKTWQINDSTLKRIDTTMFDEGHIERDLEQWIMSNPEIIGADIMIIGHQVPTDSGPIDLLGIDSSGNTVIIELKRGSLNPRKAIGQAIDYAASVAGWGEDGSKLNEECKKYTKKELEDAFSEAFHGEVEWESITLNSTQRIILVGFAIESSLERMIEWLSDRYEVDVNAIILNFAKTTQGTKLLMRTSLISEEIEHVRRGRKFELSDTPGNYGNEELKDLLLGYLSDDKVTNQRIRRVLLPSLLKIEEPDKLSHDQLKEAFISIPPEEHLEYSPNYEESNVPIYVNLISTQLGLKKNDFLRQIIAYDRNQAEKDNFSIRKLEYRDLIKEVLEKLKEM